MCSGKVHTGIGVVSASALAYVGVNGFPSVTSVTTSVIAGAVLGSLIVDIDSERSKASQAYSKVITGAIWLGVLAVLGGKYIPNLNNSEVLRIVLGYFSSNLSLIIFAILATLGKLSPHRGFTHKWFGTALFIIVGYLAFSKFLFFGYIVGYIAHLVADELFTKTKLRFFKFQLPCQDTKGKLSINI